MHISIYCITVISFTTVFAAPTRKGKPKTTSCGLTKLKANALMKEFTSPGYPGEFPEQTQCTWLINAPKGFRVKVKIRDFYLLNQRYSNCKMQYLLFTDDFTGKMYGPLCGKMPKEEIISSANTLRIKLESDSVDVGIPYRGFKFTYTQTNDPTSEILRDKAGLWRKYFVPSATLAPSARPTDGNVDENDNESINRKNQLANQKNDKINEERKIENFVPETSTVPQKIQPTLKPTTFPGRWIPPKRNIKRPIAVKTRRPPSRPIYPSYRTPKKAEEKEEGSSGTTAAKSVAIILAVLLVVAALLFAAFKIRRRKQKKKKADSNDTEIPNISKTISLNNTQNVIKPEKSHYHNYEMVEPKIQHLPVETPANSNSKYSKSDRSVNKHLRDPAISHSIAREDHERGFSKRDINYNEKGQERETLKEKKGHDERRSKIEKRSNRTKESRTRKSEKRDDRERPKKIVTSSNRKGEKRENLNGLKNSRTAGRSTKDRKSSKRTRGDDQRQTRPKTGHSKKDTRSKTTRDKRRRTKKR